MLILGGLLFIGALRPEWSSVFFTPSSNSLVKSTTRTMKHGRISKGCWKMNYVRSSLRSPTDSWLSLSPLAFPHDNDELFASILYNAVCLFCNAPSPPLPIRKLLLLLWKVLLVRIAVPGLSLGSHRSVSFQFTLGGLDEAFEQKNRVRGEHHLDPITENPAKVIARMPPISPPLAGAECLEMQGQVEMSSSARRAKRQSFTKQSALDTDAVSDDGSTTNSIGSNPSSDDDGSTIVSSSSLSSAESMSSLASEASSVDPTSTLMMRELPWVPKVRQKDLEAFLDHTRKKFVGFSIKDDLTTLIGLPKPIHESIKILKQVRSFFFFVERIVRWICE